MDIRAVADMIEAREVVTEAVEAVTGMTTGTHAMVAVTMRLHQAGSHLLLEPLALALVLHHLLPRHTMVLVVDMVVEAILSLMPMEVDMARHHLRLVTMVVVVVVVDIRDIHSLLHRAAMTTVMEAAGVDMVVAEAEVMIVVGTTMAVVDIGDKKCSNGCPRDIRCGICGYIVASSAHLPKSLRTKESKESFASQSQESIVLAVPLQYLRVVEAGVSLSVSL